MKTIKEIAKIANVSAGTIDRVLHNRKGVSPKTREKVLAILREHEYERNMIASTLAIKKRYLIATLIPSADSLNTFWEQPNLGILEAGKSIKDYGFSIRPFYFNQFDVRSYVGQFRELIKTEPDAVLIAPIFLEPTKEMDTILSKKGIPFVFINVEAKGMHNLSYIGQHAGQAGFLAGKLMHLLVEDTTEILIVRQKRLYGNHNAIENRIQGFLRYFDSVQPAIHILSIELEGSGKPEMNELTRTLLKNHRISGIYVPSSFVNVIAAYLEEFELSHLKLIGYDINPASIRFLSSDIINFMITQKPYDQGFRGIKVLSDYLLHGHEPEKIQYAPIKIITKENVDYYKW